MSEGVRLRADYVTISGSYGGNQEWFRDDVFGNGDLIRFGGCGLIAMADSLLYLESQGEGQGAIPSLVNVKKLTKSTYKLFVESLFYQYLQPWRNPFFNPAKYQDEASFVLGIQGWQLRQGLNRFFQHPQSRFYSAKSKKKFSQLIQQQLKRNRPVPLMIGPTKAMFPVPLNFLGRQQEVVTHLLFSVEQAFPPKDTEGRATTMSAHWVTVTGYYQENNQEYLVVSSWGEPYRLSLTAYLADGDWIGGLVVI